MFFFLGSVASGKLFNDIVFRVFLNPKVPEQMGLRIHFSFILCTMDEFRTIVVGAKFYPGRVMTFDLSIQYQI